MSTTIERVGMSVTNIAVVNPDHLVGMTFATPTAYETVSIYETVKDLQERVKILEKKIDALMSANKASFD